MISGRYLQGLHDIPGLYNDIYQFIHIYRAVHDMYQVYTMYLPGLYRITRYVPGRYHCINQVYISCKPCTYRINQVDIIV